MLRTVLAMLLLLGSSTATLAQEQLNLGIIPLPTVLLCGVYDPENFEEKILENYGEIPFVEGDGEVITPDINKSYHGKVRIFLDPNDQSYSIFLDINNELTCLLTTGEKLSPIFNGEKI